MEIFDKKSADKIGPKKDKERKVSSFMPIRVKMTRVRNKERKTCIQKLNLIAFLLPSDSLQIPTVHVVFKYLIKHCQHVQLLQIQCTQALMLEIYF